MIRVAFLLGALDQSWLGGVNYYRGLIYALKTLPHSNIQPVVITGSSPSPELTAALENVEIIRTSLLDRYSSLWTVSKICRTFLNIDPLLERFLLHKNIQVISHAPYIGRIPRLLVIGWIPDFQYKYLPDFFSKAEIQRRNTSYESICRNSDAVIASSHSARTDLLTFAPYLKPEQALMLRFTSGIRFGQRIPDIDTLRQKYNFGEKYFFLPNQFWMHKNHRLVFEALKILKGQSESIDILFTGNSFDAKNPLFFDSLMTYAEHLGIRQHIHLLGITPYEDLLGLMAHSIALINPSLFEGWSTTVEEAKALGKQLILSDIPVHNEQAPTGTIFFKTTDANALAKALQTTWHQYDRAKDANNLESSLNNADQRWRSYGNDYHHLITTLVRHKDNV
jgi:glycosyltransferase involved in cell wall biosynthesis